MPAGKDKDGNIIYSDPVGDYLSASLLNDPRAIEYFRTKAYVEARSFYDKDKEKYGDKQAGMNAWADDYLSQFEMKEDEIIADLETKEKVALNGTHRFKRKCRRFNGGS